jgi:uncharacterized Fe-S center protein
VRQVIFRLEEYRLSIVYFAKALRNRYHGSESLVSKLSDLLDKIQIKDIVSDKDLVAIKMHLGVIGGYRTIRPQFIRKVVDIVRDLGGNPFLTDTWGFGHMKDAHYGGYSYTTCNAFVLPANGIKENDFRLVKLDNSYHISEVKVAGNIYDADVLINYAHGKGHGSCGYGGLIKNLALGGTTGDLRSHEHNLEKTKYGARDFQQGMVDVVKAVLSNKKQKSLHIAWLFDIVEHCDCANFGMVPIVPDIGILVSTDIVAVEKASIDIINKAPPVQWSGAEKFKLNSGDNKFLKIHGKDPYVQVEAARDAGLGNMEYTLVEV